MKKYNRTIRKTVRLNEAEWEKLQELCKPHGLTGKKTPSKWIQEKIQNARLSDA